MHRRDFLKGLGAGAAAWQSRAQNVPRRAADVRISAETYRAADYPIRPKPYAQVKITDGFWQPKIRTNAEVTIPFEVRKFGELDRSLSGGVLEAAILSLQTHPNPELERTIDARIREMKKEPGRGNSRFEIAATHYVATGRRDLLDDAIRDAEALYENFRRKSPPFTGGERDALNCVQLYRVTRDRKHLDLAKQYLDIRGLEDSLHRSRHNQSYRPVLEQSEAVGHAVNAVTLMVSLADVGVLTGIRGYFDAAHRMWQDIARSKLYITGGVGSTGNEGFGEPYSLPNISAYCETCAVLMFITLNHRLFLATGDSGYIDVMERGMYNNAIDGVSAAGDRFFYVNRLASAGDGRDERWQHASLECCPPNLVRFLAGMPGLVYAQEGGSVYVNLYLSSATDFDIDGKRLGLSVSSEMPWGGKSKIECTAGTPVAATLKLRVPGWAVNRPAPGGLYSYLDSTAGKVRVSVNGKDASAAANGLGYISLERTWHTGDVVEIEFPFDTKRVAADRRVREARR